MIEGKVEGKDYLINRYTGEKWLIVFNRKNTVARLVIRSSDSGNTCTLFYGEEEDVNYAKEVFGFDLK